jgi:metal transporter CNNM
MQDEELVAEILRKGYSRIPIYEPSSVGTFIGCLTIRNLVGYDCTDLKPVSSIMSQMLPQCPPDLTLIEGASG